MRREVLSHADLPCEPLGTEMYGEPWYSVESTGAIVTLSSSVALLHFYCSRLPSDRSAHAYCIYHFSKSLSLCIREIPFKSYADVVQWFNYLQTWKNN